jgi:hypothetical protein
MSYNWQHASMQAWEKLHVAGRLTGPPARFFAPRKPVEELYDVQRDPWQVHNLAADPAYAGELARLRSALYAQMRSAGDLGLLPERELHARAAGMTPYDLATDARRNPLEELQRAADLANQLDPRRTGDLAALLKSPDAAIRWWGATGLLALRADAAPEKAALTAALQDESPDIRITAAEALAQLGAADQTLPVLAAALRLDDPFARFSALLAARRLGPLARPLIPAIREAKITAPGFKDIGDYVGRMVEYLPAQLDR